VTFTKLGSMNFSENIALFELEKELFRNIRKIIEAHYFLAGNLFCE
jgi:hypothetical protein